MKKLLLAFLLILTGCTVVSNKTSVMTDSQAGYLSFEVKPEDASIFVDGEEVGLAKYFTGKKRRIKVLPGQHTVEIKRAGYKDIRQSFYMSDTEEHFAYDMVPVEGSASNAIIRT